jgi:hypothetical protein
VSWSFNLALDPTTTSPIFSAALISAGISGQNSIQLATGIALGLYQYTTSALVVLTIDVGTVGTGVGTGVGIILPPPAIMGGFFASFPSAGIKGIMAPAMITALASAFSSVLSQASIQSVHAGVGVGSGIVQIVPNSAASVPLFTSALQSTGFNGVSSPQLASAIALGLDSAFPTAKGVVVITGSPSIYPGTGAGRGFLL